MRVTVAVPCFNEAPTVIAKIVGDFSRELPDAEIVVFDNASTDDTAAQAEKAGARVVREKRRGKGSVMQSVFEKVRSDVVVIVDGDDTYFAEDVHELLKPVVEDRADMVVGNRLREASDRALNDLRRFGNHLIIRIMNMVFRTAFRDVLSGYRVLNRHFLETVPLITGGFAILADAGGSNGYRCRGWKHGLQTRICNRHDIAITIAHYPSGTSKWNPVEHRLFSEISKNWAGRPLDSYETILKYIRTTTTSSGLRVRAHLIRRRYPKGVKITDERMQALSVTKDQTLPKWNYTIRPS